MLDSLRFRQMLDNRGLSQSELARRVGISQTSVAKLASGSGYGSKYIHRIARELGTTPEYLMGETDNPHEGAAPPPVLNFTDRELLESFRALADDDQRALLQIVRSMAGKAKPRTLNAATLGFRGEAD